jgi:hypothetical protein
MSSCRRYLLSMRWLLVTLPLIAPPSGLPCLVFPSPLIAPTPLNVLATLMHHPLVFPCWLLHHLTDTTVAHCHHPAVNWLASGSCCPLPLQTTWQSQRRTPQSHRHPTVHCAAAAFAHRDCAAACTGTSIVASPLAAPPTLNAPNGCHVISHRPPSCLACCCITPQCRHNCPFLPS